MGKQIQPAFWDGVDPPPEARNVRMDELEHALFSDPDRFGRWAEGYQKLRALGVRWTYAAYASWKAIHRDDRGGIRTVKEFSRWLGRSESTIYQWPQRAPIDDWAKYLRTDYFLDRMAEVDQRTYEVAVSEDGSATDRKLFYQRSGVWDDERTLHLVGDDDGPIEYTDVTERELDAIRRALTTEAESGS
jgi:hypothetical protein